MCIRYATVYIHGTALYIYCIVYILYCSTVHPVSLTCPAMRLQMTVSAMPSINSGVSGSRLSITRDLKTEMKVVVGEVGVVIVTLLVEVTIMIIVNSVVLAQDWLHNMVQFCHLYKHSSSIQNNSTHLRPLYSVLSPLFAVMLKNATKLYKQYIHQLVYTIYIFYVYIPYSMYIFIFQLHNINRNKQIFHLPVLAVVERVSHHSIGQHQQWLGHQRDTAFLQHFLWEI